MIYLGPSASYDISSLLDANPVGLDYLVRNERIKKDFSRLVQDKRLEKERLPWGFYGWTTLIGNGAYLNELLDQVPDFKREVDDHECSHCNWEYRTRVISKDRVREESREDIIKRLMEFSYVCLN